MPAKTRGHRPRLQNREVANMKGLAALFMATATVAVAQITLHPHRPRTFDAEALSSTEVPLATPEASPVQISPEVYYRAPVRPIYRSYPVYHPSREPAGYFEWLAQQEPEIVFDPANLHTMSDWIRAGELVFDAPTAFGGISGSENNQFLRDVRWYQNTQAPIAADGSLPFYRYVIREKGKIEVGVLSCSMCHTRVMVDKSVVRGAQGNFPFDRALALEYRGGTRPLNVIRVLEDMLYAAPCVDSDPVSSPSPSSIEENAARDEAIPAGVMARQGTSPLYPAKVPDLIGIKDRRYLDATGLVRHRDIGDLMRYAAMNQDTDPGALYGGFRPADEIARALGITLPDNAADNPLGARYSDEELYALAVYIYSLQSPQNPNTFDSAAEQGQKVFERERCGSCHTPPLYTNNKLTLAAGFTPDPEDLARFDVLPVSVGTDPNLALRTRRGTGYYKVPSLKGVWYRGPFEHDGSVATLEDWFDPKRLRDDYVPTGFKRDGVKTRAVPGHKFGLDLSTQDRRALIAFLKTL